MLYTSVKESKKHTELRDEIRDDCLHCRYTININHMSALYNLYVFIIKYTFTGRNQSMYYFHNLINVACWTFFLNHGGRISFYHNLPVYLKVPHNYLLMGCPYKPVLELNYLTNNYA